MILIYKKKMLLKKKSFYKIVFEIISKLIGDKYIIKLLNENCRLQFVKKNGFKNN